MRASTKIAAFSGLIALLGAARDAHAWCRTTTDEQQFVPTDDKPCDDVGYPLYWSSSCVSYDVQQDASTQVTYAVAAATEAKAFDAWETVSCPSDPVACTGDATGSPSISGTDFGAVSCSEVQYNKAAGNANIIMFRDSTWPHTDGADGTLALTTVTFDVDTGEIYDADMEVNSNPTTTTLTTTDTNVVYDLQSIMTHETGHFLGLAHTQPVHTDATMYFEYDEGSIAMRTPSADDICGICAIYPPDRAAACAPTPRHGFALGCDGEGTVTPAKSGCSYAPAPADRSTSPRSSAIASLATLAALASIVTRRARR